MAVTVAVEFDLDTPTGGADTTELDLDTGRGGRVSAVTVELDLDTGWGGFVGVDVKVDERTVAAEFEREREGEAGGSRPLKEEGTLDNGGRN
jgi:hypothetical protein